MSFFSLSILRYQTFHIFPYLYVDADFTHAGLTPDADFTRAVLHLTMFMIHPLQLHYSLIPSTTHKSSWAYMVNLAVGLFPIPSGILRNIGWWHFFVTFLCYCLDMVVLLFRHCCVIV